MPEFIKREIKAQAIHNGDKLLFLSEPEKVRRGKTAAGSTVQEVKSGPTNITLTTDGPVVELARDALVEIQRSVPTAAERRDVLCGRLRGRLNRDVERQERDRSKLADEVSSDRSLDWGLGSFLGRAAVSEQAGVLAARTLGVEENPEFDGDLIDALVHVLDDANYRLLQDARNLLNSTSQISNLFRVWENEARATFIDNYGRYIEEAATL